jgi:hypothetical protein
MADVREPLGLGPGSLSVMLLSCFGYGSPQTTEAEGAPCGLPPLQTRQAEREEDRGPDASATHVATRLGHLTNHGLTVSLTASRD